MGLPRNLFFVRHGESEGNVALNAAKHGDESHFTEEYMNRPGRAWALSPVGVEQATAAGLWLQKELERISAERLQELQDSRLRSLILDEDADHDEKASSRFYVSPLVRTKETASYLSLTNLGASRLWRLNRSIRERDWGDIELMTKTAYREAYPDSAKKERLDPLYWRPPGGESIADVAENRVRNFFDTLHRECNHQDVVAVSHGEFIRAVHLTLTRINDEVYEAWEGLRPPSQEDTSGTKLEHNSRGQLQFTIKNCEIFHYTRQNPFDPHEYSSRVSWFRRARPVLNGATGEWTVEINQDWTPIVYSWMDNDSLLNSH